MYCSNSASVLKLKTEGLENTGMFCAVCACVCVYVYSMRKVEGFTSFVVVDFSYSHK